jgi:hypothetical protein
MESARGQGLLQRAGVVVREAVLVAAVSSLVGIAIDLIHPRGIPLIARQEYEILVPCPEPGGEVNSVKVDDPVLHHESTFVVDARSEEQHRAWRFRQAVVVPYDYLYPTPEEAIRRLAKAITQSRAQRVVVYGDGERPDSGEQLGKELSGHGIRNVHFVLGGAPALEAAEPPAGGSR